MAQRTTDLEGGAAPRAGPAGVRGHSHGPGLPASTTAEGLRAVYIATAGMAMVALIELGFFALANSAGLLSDALHNLGDIFTTVALFFAFRLSLRPATRRYTYGYHRAEDLAGAFIALVIVASALAAGYESYRRLIGGSLPAHIGWALGAALFGFLGNEALAQYKIGVGRRIDSRPLIADGLHSRADGLTSLAAAAGLALTGWAGIRSADPIAGLVIAVAILYILVDVGRDVLSRLLDSVEPHVIDAIEAQARAVAGVRQVTEVRARWAGRRLFVALNVAADSALTLAAAHDIAETVRQEVLAHVQGAATVDVHGRPLGPARRRRSASLAPPPPRGCPQRGARRPRSRQLTRRRPRRGLRAAPPLLPTPAAPSALAAPCTAPRRPPPYLPPPTIDRGTPRCGGSRGLL